MIEPDVLIELPLGGVNFTALFALAFPSDCHLHLVPGIVFRVFMTLTRRFRTVPDRAVMALVWSLRCVVIPQVVIVLPDGREPVPVVTLVTRKALRTFMLLDQMKHQIAVGIEQLFANVARPRRNR